MEGGLVECGVLGSKYFFLILTKFLHLFFSMNILEHYFFLFINVAFFPGYTILNAIKIIWHFVSVSPFENI